MSSLYITNFPCYSQIMHSSEMTQQFLRYPDWQSKLADGKIILTLLQITAWLWLYGCTYWLPARNSNLSLQYVTGNLETERYCNRRGNNIQKARTIGIKRFAKKPR